GDFHVHTDWSEGTNSISEMVEAAKKLGYQYIAITDHSRALGVAHGMSEERLFEQIEEINKLNDNLDDFHIFAGIEVDIKADSNLDFPDSILKQCEVVIAALHTGQRQTRREITGRLLTAMENENVDIIAHPTGRIIGKREEYDVDIDVLLDAATSTGTVLEINAHPARLDLSDANSRKGKNKGVRFGIGTDAHNSSSLGNMEFGVNVARRGWLEKKDVMNSRSYRDVRFKS
ncbi:MAG: PHP domain-containing protein, partial [Candidatus Methanoperedens sp.]|nr:PHP domain-containing protein [Candidatus Methanoperedens sp.]